jgi:hypothetical protein
MIAAAALVALVVGCSGTSDAQTTDDPCASAQAQDASQAADYGLQKAKLQGSSAEYREALLALSEAQLALTKRVPKELFQARFNAETAKIKTTSSAALRELQASIGQACVDRLLKTPGAEIAALNQQAKAIRSLLESPKFEDLYKQETARIQADYATEQAAAQALKAALDRLRRQIA